jgi:hypothetical protein
VTPQNWRAQIIIFETKLPKIAKKIAELEGRVGGDNKYPIRVGGDNKYPSGGHK